MRFGERPESGEAAVAGNWWRVKSGKVGKTVRQCLPSAAPHAVWSPRRPIFGSASGSQSFGSVGQCFGGVTFSPLGLRVRKNEGRGRGPAARDT